MRRLVFITLDQWRALVNTVMKLWAPLNPRKVLNGCTTGGLTRKVQLHGVS
jgi:hypothetical protein